MKNRPSKLDVIATPARASERNQRLAAEMESRDSVKSAIRDNRKWGKSNHSNQAHFQPYQHHRPSSNNQKGKSSSSDSKKSKSKKSKNNKSNEKNEKDDEGNRKKQKPEVDPKDLDAELEAYNAARAKKKSSDDK